jgi:hypothetical protein
MTGLKVYRSPRTPSSIVESHRIKSTFYFVGFTVGALSAAALAGWIAANSYISLHVGSAIRRLIGELALNSEKSIVFGNPFRSAKRTRTAG